VLLPDLFHRSGRQIHFDPAVAFSTAEEREKMRAKIGPLTTDMTMRDVAACLDTLAARPNVDATRIGVIGFCMGGRNAFVAATRFPDRIRAIVGLHPGGVVTADPASPHLSAEHAKAYLYLGIAKDDASFTREQADTLEALLTKLGKRHEIVHYEARHGWAVDDTPVRDDAQAQRAWDAALRVFGRELA
jgi:carboxymethylenebutenolidase